MSMVIDQKVTCPRCGTESIFYQWLSVTSWLDPEAAEMAKEGTLNQFTCKKCGFTTVVGSDVLVSWRDSMTLYTAQKEEKE